MKQSVSSYFSKATVRAGELRDAAAKYMDSVLGARPSDSSASVLSQLLAVVRAVVSNIMFYIEDALTEHNPQTAMRAKSLYGMASVGGQRWRTGHSAVAYCQLGFKAGATLISGSAYIPQGARLSNGKSVFVTTEPVIVRSNSGFSSTGVVLREGTAKSAAAVCTGGENFACTFDDTSHIDFETVRVYVDGSEYVETGSIMKCGAGDLAYTMTVSPEGGISIMFGDGVHGHAPKEGALVTCTWMAHSGAAANTEDLLEFSFLDPVFAEDGTPVDANNTFYIKSAGPIVSGCSPKPPSWLRQNIGKSSRTDVLCTRQAVESYVSEFGFARLLDTVLTPAGGFVSLLCVRDMYDTKHYPLTDQQEMVLKAAMAKDCLAIAGAEFIFPKPAPVGVCVTIGVSGADDDEMAKTEVYRSIWRQGLRRIDAESVKEDLNKAGVRCTYCKVKTHKELLGSQYSHRSLVHDSKTGTLVEKPSGWSVEYKDDWVRVTGLGDVIEARPCQLQDGTVVSAITVLKRSV